MAFVKVDKSHRGMMHNLEPAVTMGSYLADGKVHKSKSIAFRISRPLVDQLGWPLKEGKIGISVHEGTDTDKGFLQLVHDDVAGYRGSQGTGRDNDNQGISINVTADRFKHYVLNECPVSSNLVTHMVDNGALIVECPDWLRYNPQSVPEPEPAPPKVTPTLNREQRRALATRVARNLKR